MILFPLTRVTPHRQIALLLFSDLTHSDSRLCIIWPNDVGSHEDRGTRSRQVARYLIALDHFVDKHIVTNVSDSVDIMVVRYIKSLKQKR